MKARLPKGMGAGPSNMQGMIKQAQKMQEDMEAKKAELDLIEHKVAVGGGMIELTITGAKEVKAIEIKPEIIDPEEVEMLQDLIIAAVNEGIRKVEEVYTQEMEGITGALNIPGML